MKIRLSLPFFLMVLSLFFIFSLAGQDTLTCEGLNKMTEKALENYNLEEAKYWLDKASQTCASEPNRASIGFSTVAYNMGIYYYYNNNLDSAMVWFEESLERMRESGVQEVESAARALMGKGLAWAELGSLTALDSAKYYQVKALQLVKDSIGENSLLYAEGNHHLGIIYQYLTLFEKADSVYQKALAITGTLGDSAASLKENILFNMAALYEDWDDFERALPIYHELYPKFEQKSDYERAFFLGNYGVLCIKLGLFQEAEKVLKIALDLKEKILGKTSENYCLSLLNFTELYKKTNQKHLADSIYQILPELARQTLGVENPFYGQILMNYGVFAEEQGKQVLADSLLKLSLDIFEHSLGKFSDLYGIALHSLASVYGSYNNIHVADPLFKKSLEIVEVVRGKQSLDYGRSIADYGWLYDKRGRYKEAFPLYEEAIKNLRENMRRNFLLLSEAKQERFFAQFERYFWVIGSFCHKAKEQVPQAAALAYDDALLLKQFRMENGKSLRQAMSSEKDSVLLKRYNTWLEHRRLIARQLNVGIEERLFDLDSLQIEVEKLENELMVKTPFRQAQQRVNWQDVQSRLQTDEAAIEFYHFGYKSTLGTDSVLYYAMLLRPQSKYPEMIFLFEEKQLEGIIRQYTKDSEEYVGLVYRNPKLYQLIWQPLDSLLRGVKRVYYSPSGLLHRVSFPAIAPKIDSILLTDKYDLHYVTSTRNLVVVEEKLYRKHIQTGVIYGGIRYETDSKKMKKAKLKLGKDFKTPNKLAKKNTEAFKIDSLWNTKLIELNKNSPSRGIPIYLEGSVKEMEKVKNIFISNGIFTRTLREYEASEESFKRIGTIHTSPDVIHLSTHGFFRTDTLTYGDNPLFRGGLLFSGCLRTWQGHPPLKGFEDGILYSYEAANLNLSKTKLLVLSACETGLGDIQGGEGIYGLQRAFKLAGVQHIIMSLWKISDDATVEFMETFYQNWFSRDIVDIREAFVRTQQLMRKKYKNPHYWAAFVLI